MKDVQGALIYMKKLDLANYFSKHAPVKHALFFCVGKTLVSLIYPLYI